MHTKTMLIIDASDERRESLKALLEKESCEVFAFNNSMSAILWIKKNAAPVNIIIEEEATPLNASKTRDYIEDELKMELPSVIISEKNRDLPGFITTPITAATVAFLKNFFKKPANLGEKQPEIPIYSLQYLKDTYDDNEELILESLNIFENSVSVKIEEMQSLLLNKQFEEVRKAAHNIKPSFEMLGNKKGSMLCHSLAHDAPVEHIDQMVATLNNEFKLLKDNLNRHLN